MQTGPGAPQSLAIGVSVRHMCLYSLAANGWPLQSIDTNKLFGQIEINFNKK